MLVQSYLFFDGRCEEALAFYRQALGAEIEMMMRFSESPDRSSIPPGADDKILHASVRIGDTTLMASDGHCQGSPSFQGFSLAITTATVDETKRIFQALSEGGQVSMPLAKTFYSPLFGMTTDRFGVGWMVMTKPAA